MAARHVTGYVYDPVFLLHDTGNFHPERPERIAEVDSALRETEWFANLVALPVREATVDEIALVHDRGYIGRVERECRSGYSTLSTGDTDICAKSYRVALKAAGGVLSAVDAVMTGTVHNAWCVVRPPGHHATPNRGMGFCIFNNVAVAARYAQKKYGIDRALIADWDVHHGNGTQDAFYENGSVFYMSTHRHPFYPGTGMRHETGDGAGAGTTMNRPLPAGAGRQEVVGAFLHDLLPAARAFKPDLVLISAGFDSRRGDLLGGFNLDDEDFRELTRIMLEIAETGAGGRIVSVLEGGYTIGGLATAACAHVGVLAGDVSK
jgi:acetoin utilization deacetylase AcuC-like enzyme